MGRKAVFKNLLPRDLEVIVRKAEVMRELLEHRPMLNSTSGHLNPNRRLRCEVIRPGGWGI
jgi:hypothetical protein